MTTLEAALAAAEAKLAALATLRLEQLTNQSLWSPGAPLAFVQAELKRLLDSIGE